MNAEEYQIRGSKNVVVRIPLIKPESHHSSWGASKHPDSVGHSLEIWPRGFRGIDNQKFRGPGYSGIGTKNNYYSR